MIDPAKLAGSRLTDAIEGPTLQGGAAAVDGFSPLFLLFFNIFCFGKLGSMVSRMGIDHGIEAITHMVQDKGLADLGSPLAEVGAVTRKAHQQALNEEMLKHDASGADPRAKHDKDIFDLQYLIWKSHRNAAGK